jgi:hypothetical protein
MRSASSHASRLVRFLGFRPLSILCFLLSFLNHCAYADIWGYVDEKGVAHFAAERTDERYELFFRGGESFDTGTGVSAVTDRPDAFATPAAVPAAASKVLAFLEISPSYGQVKHHLRAAASKHQIDYDLLTALIATESGFDPMAVSPKGAVGLMQVMPATAARYGIAGDKKTSIEKKLSDPETNINTGSRYLRDLIDLFPGQLELALAAYNAGEGAVQRAGNKIPNYQETQNYVRTVMQLYTLLKPPPLIKDKRHTPVRVRMQMPGGATDRGNMISSTPSVTQAQGRN